MIVVLLSSRSRKLCSIWYCLLTIPHLWYWCPARLCSWTLDCSLTIHSLQQYADDTQLYIASSSDNVAGQVNQLESCPSSLHSCFCHSSVTLNINKSGAIVFGTQQWLGHFPQIPAVEVPDPAIPISDRITILGATLDSNVTFNKPIHVFRLPKCLLSHQRTWSFQNCNRQWHAKGYRYFSRPVSSGICELHPFGVIKCQLCLYVANFRNHTGSGRSIQLHWNWFE